MKKIQKAINRLRESKRIPSPVSYRFHCDVGNILAQNDDEINNLNQQDKVLLESNLIPPLP